MQRGKKQNHLPVRTERVHFRVLLVLARVAGHQLVHARGDLAPVLEHGGGEEGVGERRQNNLLAAAARAEDGRGERNAGTAWMGWKGVDGGRYGW